MESHTEQPLPEIPEHLEAHLQAIEEYFDTALAELHLRVEAVEKRRDRRRIDARLTQHEDRLLGQEARIQKLEKLLRWFL